MPSNKARFDAKRLLVEIYNDDEVNGRSAYFKSYSLTYWLSHMSNEMFLNLFFNSCNWIRNGEWLNTYYDTCQTLLLRGNPAKGGPPCFIARRLYNEKFIPPQ